MINPTGNKGILDIQCDMAQADLTDALPALPKLTEVRERHQARKRFGQNFLQDQQVIMQIIDAMDLHRQDRVIEIGPGMGALTKPLLDALDALTVIELDRDLADSLRMRIGAFSHPNFTIITDNALNVDYAELAKAQQSNVNNAEVSVSNNVIVPSIEQTSEHQGSSAPSLRIVGNLPYNISTPVLFHLLRYHQVIKDMHFMLQKEVVDRITAEVNTKQYGRLSVIMQYHCATDYLLTVSPHAFRPAPKVTSAVFRLTPHLIKPVTAIDEEVFSLVVREVFNQRRKTLRAIFKKHALLPSLSEADFAAIEIDGNARPETLTVAQFVTLSNLVVQQQSVKPSD